jgi:HEAT repeat protein
LANRSFIVQYYAARGLSEIGTPEAIQGLIDALEYENITSRETAIEWLGYSRAKGALPKLIKLLDDENATIRLATLRALSNIGDKSSIAAVKKRLEDPDQQVRETARKVLDYLQKQ